MDTTVTGIGSVVVAELRAAGYLESTIGQYEKTIKALTCFGKERGGTYTPSLGAAFASMTISPRTGRVSAQRRFDYRRLVSVFDTYLATGRVDLSCRRRGGGGTHPESCEFTALAAAWNVNMDGRDLARANRDAYGPGIPRLPGDCRLRHRGHDARSRQRSHSRDQLPAAQRLAEDKLQALCSLR
jgi:hypothetical protein